MSNSRPKTNYRAIWRKHHGPIPHGHHIHHIDGNSSNNDIANLACITMFEHYLIHHTQGDYGACWAMARTGHLKLSPKERSELSKLVQHNRLEDGTHHFLNPTTWRRDYRGSNNPNYGKHWSADKKEALSNLRKSNGKSAGKNNPMYGCTRDDLAQRNKAGRGKHWYTDGTISKQCFAAEVPLGWYRGRTIQKK